MSLPTSAAFPCYGAPATPATPATGASSSLWERRRASKQGASALHTPSPLKTVTSHAAGSLKAGPATAFGAIGSRKTSGETPRSEVDINVLSLVLEMPLLHLDRPSNGPLSCPPAMTTFAAAAASKRQSPSPLAYQLPLPDLSPRVPAPNGHSLQQSFSGQHEESRRFDSAEALQHLQGTDRTLACEINTARTAVTSALSIFAAFDDDVDDDEEDFDALDAAGPYGRAPLGRLVLPPRSCGGAASPSSPVSPVDSTFGTDTEGGPGSETKKKGRARMSQEKRKRLARRRERESLVRAALASSGGVAQLGLDGVATYSTSPLGFGAAGSPSLVPSDFAAYGLPPGASLGGVSMTEDSWGRRSLDSLAGRPSLDGWGGYASPPASAAASQFAHHRQSQRPQPQPQQQQQKQQQYYQHQLYHSHHSHHHAPQQQQQQRRSYSAQGGPASPSWDVFQPMSPTSPSIVGTPSGWAGFSYGDLPSPSPAGRFDLSSNNVNTTSSSSSSSSSSAAAAVYSSSFPSLSWSASSTGSSSPCSSTVTTPQTSPTKYEGSSLPATLVTSPTSEKTASLWPSPSSAASVASVWAKQQQVVGGLRPPRLVVEPPSPQRIVRPSSLSAREGSWRRSLSASSAAEALSLAQQSGQSGLVV